MTHGMFENAELPFATIGNRRYLTAEQLADQPVLAEFVKRFSSSFEHDPKLDVWWFTEPDLQRPDRK